jgi:hypothetical protein
MTDDLTPSQYNADLADEYGDFLEDTYDSDFDPADEDSLDPEGDYYWSEVEQGMYDDDPNPYFGDYSEM